jgi:hypothetical protein
MKNDIIKKTTTNKSISKAVSNEEDKLSSTILKETDTNISDKPIFNRTDTSDEMVKSASDFIKDGTEKLFETAAKHNNEKLVELLNSEYVPKDNLGEVELTDEDRLKSVLNLI